MTVSTSHTIYNNEDNVNFEIRVSVTEGINNDITM